MREDTPAYLSSQTQPYCKRQGCALAGTDMHSGASLTACWTTGSRMTNGQDGSSNDDNNPGLFTSSHWYAAIWGDGRRGHLPRSTSRPVTGAARACPTAQAS